MTDFNLRLTVSTRRLNLKKEVSLLSFIQPVGGCFVVAKMYWLFSSNFKIFEITHLFSFFSPKFSFRL